MDICGPREVVIDAKVAIGGCGGHGVISEIELGGNWSGGNGLRGMNPGGVGERGERGWGGRVVYTDAAFVRSNTEFVDNGHVSREFKIMLNESSEGRGRGGGEVPTGIVAVRVCG